MRAAPFLVLLAAGTSGCALFQSIGLAPNETDPSAVAAKGPATDEPAHVVCRHVLVSFDGQVPTATRSKDDAKRLAERVLAEAKRGRDFGDLVRLYSDDRLPDGKVALANWGVPADSDEMQRQDRRTPRGYGAVAFSLKVGEVGLVEQDENASPLGWYVIKRLK